MAGKYQEIMTALESAIVSGRLAPGERIPSERDLATSFNCHRSTVAHALSELTDRKLIVRKIGSGTFVADGKWTVGVPARMRQIVPKPTPYQQAVEKALAKSPEAPWQHLENGDAPLSWLPQGQIGTLSWDAVFAEAADGDQLGLWALREAIAEDLRQRYHFHLSPNEVLITSGTQQAIFLITHGFLNPGDAVAIEAPSYFYCLPIFQAAGLRLIPIRMEAEGPSIDDLSQAVRRTRIRMLFLNPIFQNPTGILTSVRRRNEIIHLCNRYQIPIFEDDASARLPFSDKALTSPIKASPQAGQMLYAGSISKYMGPSIRIGWLIGPAHLMRALAHFRHETDTGLSALPQYIVRDYLTADLAAQVTRLQQHTVNALGQFSDFMQARFPTLHPLAAQGGFYLYYRWPKKKRPQYEATLQALLDDHIIVAEGRHFGDDLPAMRLNFTHFRSR